MSAGAAKPIPLPAPIYKATFRGGFFFINQDLNLFDEINGKIIESFFLIFENTAKSTT